MRIDSQHKCGSFLQCDQWSGSEVEINGWENAEIETV
jgi:hypothetical protein